jgi:hypothetical protein
VPRVHAVDDDHPWILTQALVQLCASDIEGDHPRRAALEKDIGETARGRTHVERIPSSGVHSESVQRVVELFTASGDEPRPLGELERRRFVHLLARLVEAGDAPGHDQRLRLSAGLRKTALDEEHVEAFLHRT